MIATNICNSLQFHLKALMFLYAFEESVDCHLFSSFCDDSNLHIALFKYVLSTMGVSKESISKFLIFRLFMRAKLSIRFSQFSTAVTSYSKQDRQTLQNSDEKQYIHSHIV